MSAKPAAEIHKKNIIDGNELIAGLDDQISLAKGDVFKYRYSRTDGTYAIEGLRYHLSWDWLMPVIAQINKTHDESPDKIWDKIELGLCDQDIELAWEGVVKYCEWKQITEK